MDVLSAPSRRAALGDARECAARARGGALLRERLSLSNAGKVGWLALAVAGAVAVARPAGAYPLELDWDGPRDCPDIGDLHFAVERLIGEPLLPGTASRAAGRVTRDDDGRFTLALAIHTREIEGMRRVRTDSCADALEVAAFAIALAVNPELHVGTSSSGLPLGASPLPVPPSAAPEPVAAAPLPPVPTLAVAPLDEHPVRAPRPVVGIDHEPARGNPSTITRAEVDDAPRNDASPRARSFQIWLGAHGVLDSSLLPKPALGMGIAAEVRLVDWLHLGVRPALFLPQEEEIGTGAGGRFTLLSAEVYGCAAVGAFLALCPLFQYGVLHGEGRNVVPRLEQTSRIYAPGAAVLGSFAVSRGTEARVGLAGLFPMARDVFTVRDGRVHEVPPVSVELSLGGTVRAF